MGGKLAWGLRFWRLLIGLSHIAPHAAERPGWAFPVTDKVQPPSTDDGQPKTAPGSDKTYTRKQINDLFNPPDWYPDMHPPMPQVVAHGNAPNGPRLRRLPFADRHRPRRIGLRRGAAGAVLQSARWPTTRAARARAPAR